MISFGLLRRNSTLNFATRAANTKTMKMITADTTGAVTQVATKPCKEVPTMMVAIKPRIETLSMLTLVCPGTRVSFWFVVEGALSSLKDNVISFFIDHTAKQFFIPLKP